MYNTRRLGLGETLLIVLVVISALIGAIYFSVQYPYVHQNIIFGAVVIITALTIAAITNSSKSKREQNKKSKISQKLIDAHSDWYFKWQVTYPLTASAIALVLVGIPSILIYLVLPELINSNSQNISILFIFIDCIIYTYLYFKYLRKHPYYLLSKKEKYLSIFPKILTLILVLIVALAAFIAVSALR